MPSTAADRRAVAAACLAVGAVALLVALAGHWHGWAGAIDRAMILLAAAWAGWRVWRTPAAAASHPLPLAGTAAVCLGAAVWPAAGYLTAHVGPRPLLLWVAAGGLNLAAAGLLLATGGPRRLQRWAFPLLFPLLALPPPDRLAVPASGFLQEATTTLADTALTLTGVPVERAGFVLRLPAGDLGVAEACGGGQSAVTYVAAAAFVGFVRGVGWVGGGLLVLAAVPLAVAVNAGRVTLAGLALEYAGPGSAAGTWHDALGLAVVSVGLLAVVALARLVPPSDPAPPPVPLPHPPVPLAISVALVAALLASSVAFALGWHDTARAEQAAPLDDIPLSLGPWQGEPASVPGFVAELLAPTRLTHRVYANNLGRRADVWVAYWAAGGAVPGRHQPDVCWPNRGFAAARRWAEPVRFPGGGLTATAREFRRGPDRQTVLAWTQTGRRVWADADAESEPGAGGGHGWAAELLSPDPPPARLSVVLVTASAGPAAEADLCDLAARLAAELYRGCPWANPGGVIAER